MNTRITIDLQDPQLVILLRLAAAHEGIAIRDVVKNALTGYFSDQQENQALLKLAETTFAEWDNEMDADYDKL